MKHEQAYEIDWESIDEHLDTYSHWGDPDDCSERELDRRNRAYCHVGCRRQPILELTWEQLNSNLRDLWMATGMTHWSALPNGPCQCVWDKRPEPEFLDFVRGESGFLFTRGDLNCHLFYVLGARHITCLHADGNGVVMQIL